MDDSPDHDYPPDLSTASSVVVASNDVEYIPRPPNAFILFRSAFIRSRRISGRVEGNHSTLSKIIGRIWRSLKPEEREEWERKAQVALEEHKRRYPDWRFVNAQARRGRGRETEGRGRRGSRPRGGGRAGRRKPEGARVELIQELLVDGIEGEELEKAVAEWELANQHKRVEQSSSTKEGPPSASPPLTPYQPSGPECSQPDPSSPSSPSTPYSFSKFSTLVGWAGTSSSPVHSPTFSPTSVTFPSPTSSYQAYPEYVNNEFISYYDTPNPPAVSYEEPVYDNPYYPAYNHPHDSSDVIPNSDMEYLPVEPVVTLPSSSSPRYAWAQSDSWQSDANPTLPPPVPPPPNRKAIHRAPNIDEYGWQVPIQDNSRH